MYESHAVGDRVLDIEPVADVGTILAAQAAASRGAWQSRHCGRYVVALCAATREDPRLELGASPRAGLLLFRAAKARAALEGRDHCAARRRPGTGPVGARAPAAACARRRARGP